MTTTPPASPVHVAELHDIGVEGSDMTRDIHVALFQTKDRPATRSLPHVSDVLYDDVGTASDMAQPGGFRRGHVLAAASDFDGDNSSNNSSNTAPSAYARASFLDTFAPVRIGRNAVTNSYDDFIRAALGIGRSYDPDGNDDDDDDDATTPLLRYRTKDDNTKQTTTSKPIKAKEVRTGGASIRKTVFTVLKSFIGSGILFLPRAFANGGMLFTVVILFVSAMLSTFCMLRLTTSADALQRATGRHSASYGDLGAQAFGRLGRIAVNSSLVLSQLGFCCSYLIFVEQNVGAILTVALRAYGASSSGAVADFSWTLLLLQVPLYTPLAWVRRLEYFALTNLLADVLIAIGLVYIAAYSVETLAAAPPATSSDWTNFNASTWALSLGTAVYCFEGIGLVLPIYDAMDKQLQPAFPRLITYTVGVLAVVFAAFAGVVYAAFGTQTQSNVTLNLPPASDSHWTVAVQLAYSLALVLTYPLMLYPVVTIVESVVFPRRQKVKGFWKWQKNTLRFALVCVTALVAYCGKNQLDNFVALIGGFCSVPLAFIYPCLFHSQIVNDGHALNATVIVIGAFTMMFATHQALSTWT